MCVCMYKYKYGLIAKSLIITRTTRNNIFVSRTVVRCNMYTPLKYVSQNMIERVKNIRSSIGVDVVYYYPMLYKYEFLQLTMPIYNRQLADESVNLQRTNHARRYLTVSIV